MGEVLELRSQTFWRLMQDIAALKRMPPEEIDSDLEGIEEPDSIDDDEYELLPEDNDDGI